MKIPAGFILFPEKPTAAIRAVIRNEKDVYQSEDALYAALIKVIKYENSENSTVDSSQPAGSSGENQAICSA